MVVLEQYRLRSPQQSGIVQTVQRVDLARMWGLEDSSARARFSKMQTRKATKYLERIIRGVLGARIPRQEILPQIALLRGVGLTTRSKNTKSTQETQDLLEVCVSPPLSPRPVPEMPEEPFVDFW